MSQKTLYEIKPRFVEALDSITSQLAARGVSPNKVTLGAIPTALTAGAALILGLVWAPIWLLVGPVCLVLMGINAVDGALARKTGSMTPRGAVLNELVDRFGDLVIIGAGFFLVPAWLATTALVAVLLGEIVALIGWGALGRRGLVGILGKPDRALLIGAGAAVAVVLGQGAFVFVFGVIALGAATGVVQRVVWVVRNAA